MIRCPKCTSPESTVNPGRCTNANCGRWEGPPEVVVKIAPRKAESFELYASEDEKYMVPERIERLIAWANAEMVPSEEELDAAAIEEDRRFEEYRDEQIMARHEGGSR
jgi:hypothetical protein